MGSFSEIVISFTLRPDVDDDVLRAFSGLRLAEPTDGAAYRNPTVPQLPSAHERDIDDSDLYVAYDSGGFPEDFKPWMYNWTWLVSAGYGTAYIDATKGGTIAWTGHGWLITFRTTAKSHPEELVYWFGWMGEFAVESNEERPSLIGYIIHEYEKRPWLVWHAGSGPFTFEDLNGPGDRDY